MMAIGGVCVIAAIIISYAEAKINREDAEQLFFSTPFTTGQVGIDSDGFIEWDNVNPDILLDTAIGGGIDGKDRLGWIGSSWKLEEQEAVFVVSENEVGPRNLTKIWVQRVLNVGGSGEWYFRMDPYIPYMFYFRLRTIFGNSSVLSVAGYMEGCRPIPKEYELADIDSSLFLLSL